MQYSFSELPEGLQKRIRALMIVRYAYKGSENPEKEADKSLAKRKKSKKSWLYMPFACMKSVDAKRRAMGLEPIYGF